MIVSETKVRVRYSETDQMGFVYYGNYAAFYEVGRVETMRQLGTSYKEMEETGIIMPVYDMNIKYKQPGRYDDLISVKTTILEIPKTRMKFRYELRNEKGDLLNIGETTLIFLSKKTNRPIACPDWFLKILNEHFKEI